MLEKFMIFSLAGKPKTQDALSFYLLGASANVIKKPIKRM
jgi:hypothetical protein